MRRTILWSLVALLTCAALGMATVAYAHDPYVEDPEDEWSWDRPWRAPDPLVSYALYGRLDPGDDVDVFAYRFTGEQSGWPLEIIIPVCGEHFAPFYPSMALIGPGLEQPDAGDLPFDLPDGMGARRFTEAEQPEPRASYLNVHAGHVYESTRHTVDVPGAGDYMVAIWEPEAHVGAYILASGTLERFGGDRGTQRGAALRSITSGAWMRQDCNAPVLAPVPTVQIVASCPATEADMLGPFYVPGAPARDRIGIGGYVLNGVVRDTRTCAGIPGAMIEFWQVNEGGQYADTHRATIYADAQGAYRFESNRPVGYGGRPPHIHIRVSAPGYAALVTQWYPDEAGPTNAATFDLNITPGG